MKKNLFSPAIAFILGFLTLGLGNNVNIYMISDRIAFDKDGNVFYPMREAILNFITFGFYGIFWTYKISKTVSAALNDSAKGFVVLTTVMSALPFRCISMALITNKILLSERR